MDTTGDLEENRNNERTKATNEPRPVGMRSWPAEEKILRTGDKNDQTRQEEIWREILQMRQRRLLVHKIWTPYTELPKH